MCGWTSQDFTSFEALLDSLPTNAFPGKAALEAEIERAEIVEPEAIPPNVVTINSTVRFTITEASEEFSLTLACPKDVGGEHERIRCVH